MLVDFVVTCDVGHDMGFFLGFAPWWLEWNYLLEKLKEERFQGSFFKRGLQTLHTYFFKVLTKNKQNIHVERVYVLITISFNEFKNFSLLFSFFLFRSSY